MFRILFFTFFQFSDRGNLRFPQTPSPEGTYGSPLPPPFVMIFCREMNVITNIRRFLLTTIYNYIPTKGGGFGEPLVIDNCIIIGSLFNDHSGERSEEGTCGSPKPPPLFWASHFVSKIKIKKIIETIA